MDNNKNQEEVKSYIDILMEASKELPNLMLPSMGIISCEDSVDINIVDYFIQDNQ